MNKPTIISYLSTILILTSTHPTYAVKEICNPIIDPIIGCDAGMYGTSSPIIIAVLLARFFSAALAIGSVMLLIYLVVSAFRWLTARDTGTVDTARQGIFNAIIGMIILASVFAIARLVGMILGIPGFPDTIPWPTFQ